jgi:hypothetical protein
MEATRREGSVSANAPVDTLDPEALEAFLADLFAHGFIADDETRRAWTGPIPSALGPFTAAAEMQIVLRDGWPYQPPLLHVDGIRSWHADHDRLCIWQEGDDSRRWTTLAGIHERIDEWVDDESRGFASQGQALDPHLYFDPLGGGTLGLDVDELIGAPTKTANTDFYTFATGGTSSRSRPDAVRPGKRKKDFARDGGTTERRWRAHPGISPSSRTP